MTRSERTTWERLCAAADEAERTGADARYIERVRMFADQIAQGKLVLTPAQLRFSYGQHDQMEQALSAEVVGHSELAAKHLANSVLFEQVASAFDSLDRMLREPS